MTTSEWKRLLVRWSDDLIAVDSIRSTLDSSVINDRWLGFAAAAESDIETVESRLEVRLPPSYRAFLSVSNGWRATGPFVSRLFSTDELCWLRDYDSDLVSAWNDHGLERDLNECLAVSPFDDAICLLNPKRQTPRGDWDAWFFANWIPGAHKFRSFVGLIKHFRADVRRQLADQAQAQGADQSLPSLTELWGAIRAGGWQGPEHFAGEILRMLATPVRDPQHRWNLFGQLVNIRMTSEQEAELAHLAEADPDSTVRDAAARTIELRSRY